MRRYIALLITLAVVAVPTPASAETVTSYDYDQGTANAATGLLVNYGLGAAQGTPSPAVGVVRNYTGHVRLRVEVFGAWTNVNGNAFVDVVVGNQTVDRFPLFIGGASGAICGAVQITGPAVARQFGVVLGMNHNLGGGAAALKVTSMTLDVNSGGCPPTG